MTLHGVESVLYDVDDITLARRDFDVCGLALVEERYSGAIYFILSVLR